MIFLTGSTGFLGKAVLGRLLVNSASDSTDGKKIAVLVRANSEAAAGERIDGILREVLGPELSLKYRDCVLPVRGDVTEPLLGLGESDARLLAAKTKLIIHGAACTNLAQSRHDAFRNNVGGTKHVLEFANLRRWENRERPTFYHISTAYVAGDTSSVVDPNVIQLNQRFRNAYEESKSVAESAVRDLLPEIPSVILRPSIIVGDSVTGHTSAFNVIYVPARLLARGLFRTLPGSPSAPFDLVPVNYVASAVAALALIRPPQVGQCLHLCAGVGREATVGEMIEGVAAAIGSLLNAEASGHHHSHFLSDTPIATLLSRSKYLQQLAVQARTAAAAHNGDASLVEVLTLLLPPIIPYEVIAKACSSIQALEKRISPYLHVARQMAPFIPYLNSNPQFETHATNNLLQGVVAPAPLFRSYAERLFAYCFHSDWGKMKLQEDFSSIEKRFALS